MLVLRRRDGQWVEVIHAATGDILSIRVCQVEGGSAGHVNLVFDDDERNFEIMRPERADRKAAEGAVRV